MYCIRRFIFLIFIIFTTVFPVFAYSTEPGQTENASQLPETNNNSEDTSLTLNSAVRLAIANNPELAAMTWDVSAASAQIKTAVASRRPTLSLVGGYQHNIDDQRLIAARYNGEQGYFDRDIFKADIILKLPIYTGGHITAEIDIAELQKTAKIQQLSRSREELIFNVSSTFFTILGHREVIHSLDFAVDTMESHRLQVGELLAVQKAARVDMLRTDVRLANLKYSLVVEQNTVATLKRLLANLLGVGFSPNPVKPTEQPELASLPAASSEKLFIDALKTRGDYLAALAQRDSQSRQIEKMQSGDRPKVSAYAGYGIRANSLGDQEDIGSAGLILEIPIFDGGLTDARVETERARLAAAEDRLEKIRLRILQEIETALLDIQSSLERIEAARLALDQAAETLRIEQMKYKLGSGAMLDVLDAQSALLQSETNHTRAQVDYRIATARLNLATGEYEQ